MAVNRYDSPAQAQFMNTYVPIPFEQLYTLGKQAKEDVDKALESYSSALDKWSDFKSQSAVDTKSWYDETVGRAMPVIEEMSKNLDMIKSAEGRAKLYSVINNVDRAKLSMLKQNAENFDTRLKINQKLMLENKYNPLWHDVDFSNYDTLTSGIYKDLSPLGYKSVNDLVHPYVDNLKPEDMGTEGGFLMHGISKKRVRAQVDANLSSILNTPEARMHIQTLTKQGLTPEQATSTFIQQVYTAAEEKAWTDKAGADPFALENLRQQAANYRAGLKKGKTGQDKGGAPSVYDQLLQDAASNDRRLLMNQDIFKRTKTLQTLDSALEDRRQAMLSELEVYKQALADGQISQQQYDNAVKNYTKEFQLSSQSKIGDLPENAYKDDIREIFTNQFALTPGETNQAKDPIAYNGSASRTLNILMQPTSSDEINTYNTYKYGKPLLINEKDIPTEAYRTASTSGFTLATDYVNKLAGSKSAPMYVKDINGKSRDFAKDLQNGVIKGVLAIPTNTVMAQRDYTTGETPKLVQRFTLKIPLNSLIQAGYDQGSVEDFFKNNFGDKGVTNINVKGISADSVEDYYGNEKRSRWLGPDYVRNASTGTDKYFTVDVVSDIRPDDINRANLEHVRDKNRAGSTFAKENFEQRVEDTYDPYYAGDSDI